MGSGIAINLLKGGFALSVYNRTSSKAEPLGRAGARVAQNPADAVSGSSTVISMLADDAASREAWTGKNGALMAVSPGTSLVECSTLSLEWLEELSALASEQGAELIDAPVTGSRVQAEGAQLVCLVGGSNAGLEKILPVLKAISKEVVHLGPAGSGAKMKLINNFLCGVQVASLAEGIAWIEKSGLDREKAIGILKSGAPGSPLLSAVSRRMTDHNYTVNFLLRLMSKDLLYAQNEAHNVGLELKTAKIAHSIFEDARAKGYSDIDMAAVIEPFRNN